MQLKNLFKKRIIQDTLWYSATNVIIQISSLIGVLFVSRYLGPTNLGLYSFLQNYLAFFVTIFSGLDIYANWHIVQSKDYYSELIKYTKIKTRITLFLLVLFGVFSYITLPSDLFPLSLLFVIPVATSIFSSYVFILQYQNSTKRIAGTMMVSSLLLVVAKLVAVYYKLSLFAFVAINSLDGMLVVLVCVYYLTQKNNAPKISLTKKDFTDLFSASFFPLVYVFFWFVVVRIDQFFIPIYFNARELGLYSSAVKVIEMTNVLIVIMQAILLPRVALLHSPITDKDKTHLSIYLYSFFGIVSSVSIYLLAPFIVITLFGPDFTDAISILRVYAWSIPGLFISYLFSVIAMSKRSYKVLAHTSVFLALTAGLLSYFTAQSGDVLLVASVSVFIYTLSALLFYILWRRGIL